MIRVARVMAEVRRVLNDRNPDQARHDDATLKGAMNMALQDMRRMRPDVFLGMMDDVPDVMDDDVTEVDIEAMFISPWVHITTAYLMMTNSEFNQDGSATNLLALGRAQMVSPA